MLEALFGAMGTLKAEEQEAMGIGIWVFCLRDFPETLCQHTYKNIYYICFWKICLIDGKVGNENNRQNLEYF